MDKLYAEEMYGNENPEGIGRCPCEGCSGETKTTCMCAKYMRWFPKHWDALCKKGREMWRIDLPSESTNADMIAKLGEQRLAMWLCERLICSKCLEMQGAEKCEGVEGLEKWLRTRVGETP